METRERFGLVRFLSQHPKMKEPRQEVFHSCTCTHFLSFLLLLTLLSKQKDEIKCRDEHVADRCCRMGLMYFRT